MSETIENPPFSAAAGINIKTVTYASCRGWRMLMVTRVPGIRYAKGRTPGVRPAILMSDGPNPLRQSGGRNGRG